MDKSMYSLILMDSVIRQVDLQAHALGMNRSSLINQILAEHLNLPTPEKMRFEIFTHTQVAFRKTPQLKVHLPDTGSLLTISGPLSYPYTPTIRYSVELGIGKEEKGEIRVVSRTKNPELLGALEDFFQMWTMMESDFFLSQGQPAPLSRVTSGKLRRGFHFEEESFFDSQELGKSIAGYIQVLHASLNHFLEGEKEPDMSFLTEEYGDFLQENPLIL